MHACSSYHSHTFKEHRDRELTFAEYSARQVITHMLFVVHHIKSGCASLYNIAIIFAIVAVHMCIVNTETDSELEGGQQEQKRCTSRQEKSPQAKNFQTRLPGNAAP